MAIRSKILSTVVNPIPEWKGVEALPDILTISGTTPPISGSECVELDFHCAETFDRDGGIGIVETDPDVIKFEKIENTKYDDQT